VVLGAVLLGVIVLFVSCSGGDGDNTKRGQSASSHTPIPAPGGTTPSDDPSFLPARPGGGGKSLPAPNEIDSNQPNLGDDGGGTGATPSANTDGTNTNVTAPNGDLCGDVEISVTPVPSATTVKRATEVSIKFKIKNISNRTCKRDVGADPQELYLDQGARKYWSSDTCSTTRSSDVEPFTPGFEREYQATWNGRQSSKCTGALPAGPAPPPGAYELRARLGTKISEPVILTITD
jgi:hypothetical protein